MLTPKQEKQIVQSLIDSGEIDLGFAKLVLKEIKGGNARSGDTPFKRSDHYKLGAVMADWFKKLIK